MYEFGDDLTEYCENERVLVIVNHQSTADVPTLMAILQGKGVVGRKVSLRIIYFTNDLHWRYPSNMIRYIHIFADTLADGYYVQMDTVWHNRTNAW